MHFLYPEDAASLSRVADDPAHRLFRRFGEAMPKVDWNHPGTKQGIYLIGPDGEYLEGRGPFDGAADDLAARMERALERWRDLRGRRKYANKPVPQDGVVVPSGFERFPLLLRSTVRDLAAAECATTPRWRAGAFRDGFWPEFTQWAWNQGWYGVEDAAVLLPPGEAAVEVDAAWLRRVCREVFVDTVRGQAPAWRDEHVRAARLQMRRSKGKARPIVVEYDGAIELDDGEHGMTLRLHGRGEFDAGTRQCLELLLVATGERRGAHAANQRHGGPPAAPIGFVLRNHAREAPARGRRR